MSKLVAPHGGGSLKPLLVHAAERGEAMKRARTLRSIPISSREVSDLFMLGMGAYTPLDGFMGHDDWRGSAAKDPFFKEVLDSQRNFAKTVVPYWTPRFSTSTPSSATRRCRRNRAGAIDEAPSGLLPTPSPV